MKAVPKVFGDKGVIDDDAKVDIGKVDAVDITMTKDGDLNVKTNENQVKDSTVIEEEPLPASTKEMVDNVNATTAVIDDSTNITVETKAPETPNKTEPEIPSFRYYFEEIELM